MVCQHLAPIFWLAPDFVNACQRLSTQAWRLIWLTHSRLWLVNAVNLKMCTFYIPRNVFVKQMFVNGKVMKVSCSICSSCLSGYCFAKLPQASSNIKSVVQNLPQSSWAYFPLLDLPYWLPAFWKAKNIPSGKLKTCRQKGKTIRMYGTDGRYNQKAVGKAADMVLQIFSQAHPKRGWKGNSRQANGLWLQGWKSLWNGGANDGIK